MGYKQPTIAPFSIAFLKAKLHYDPTTGKWRRLGRPCAKAGYRRKDQYLFIRVGAKNRHAAHVLAWFYMTGRWPCKIVDHKDNNRKNDRWKNLRLSTWVQNRVNAKCRRDNKLGLKGVSRRSKNCYEAIITANKVRIRLGYFRTAKKAHEAYCAAAKKHFGAFARGR